MKIEEWFDVHNKEHLTAWQHLCKCGAWPAGFVPDNVESGQHWQINIMSIMANEYVNEKLSNTLNLNWKAQTAKYTNGINAYYGKIKVGEVFYSGATSRDDPFKYTVNCTLPQIKRVETNFATEQEGKDKLELLVSSWFEALK